MSCLQLKLCTSLQTVKMMIKMKWINKVACAVVYCTHLQVSCTFFPKIVTRMGGAAYLREHLKKVPLVSSFSSHPIWSLVTKLRTFHPHSCLNVKSYRKTVLNEEILSTNTRKDQSYMSKLVETMFIILKRKTCE